MKKVGLNFLKTAIPIGLGIFFVWWFIKDLSCNDKKEIINAFGQVNYYWIILSGFLLIISHISRAYRWKYILEPMNYYPGFWNSLYSVLIGYFINLAVPRLGEVSRCGIMSKYEKIPFSKLLGSIIAERVIDLVILLSFVVITVFLQYEQVQFLFNKLLYNYSVTLSKTEIIAIISILFLMAITIILFIYKLRTENKLILFLQKIIKHILEGLGAVFKIKRKYSFLFFFHTIFIWVAYLLMFYICFFALPQTSNVSLEGVFSAFVLGGITIVITNGGMGAYPIAIQTILMLYGVDKNIGGAFGWVVWTSQTVTILIGGVLSFWLISRHNKKINNANYTKS